MWGMPKNKVNCDGEHFHRVAHYLNKIIKRRPPYWCSMQPLALREFEPHILEVLEKQWEGYVPADPFWIGGEMAHALHLISMEPRFQRFVDVINTTNILLIGPKRLGKMDKYLNIKHHIVVPDKECFKVRKKVVDRASKILSEATTKMTVSVSFSMGANVLVDSLHNLKHGKRHHLLNMGSTWEPFIGHSNRTYHDPSKMKLEPLK